MAKKIKQFRYYTEMSGNGASMNYPSTIVTAESAYTPVTMTHYTTGKIFENCYPIYQLGVQSLPGTKMYINENSEPVIIGHTGIYEIDYDINTKITKLTFDSQSMIDIKNSDAGFLIVDIIYEDFTAQEEVID